MPIEFGGSSAESTGAYNPVGDALMAINSGMEAFKKYQDAKAAEDLRKQQMADIALMAQFAQPEPQPQGITLSQISGMPRNDSGYAPVGAPVELGGQPDMQGAPTALTQGRVEAVKSLAPLFQNIPIQGEVAPLRVQGILKMMNASPQNALRVLSGDPTLAKEVYDWQTNAPKRVSDAIAIQKGQGDLTKQGLENEALKRKYTQGTAEYNSNQADLLSKVLSAQGLGLDNQGKIIDLANQPTKIALGNAQTRAQTAQASASADKTRIEIALGVPYETLVHTQAQTRKLNAEAIAAENKVKNGNPLLESQVKTLTEAGQNAQKWENLSRNFKPEYAFTVPMFTDTQSALQRKFKGNPEALAWWQDAMQTSAGLTHAMYGGALTAQEIDRMKQWAISPDMNAETLKVFLGEMSTKTGKAANSTASALASAGYSGVMAQNTVDAARNATRDFYSERRTDKTTATNTVAPQGRFTIQPQGSSQPQSRFTIKSVGQ